MRARLFSTLRPLAAHENPLGLPRAGTPPRLARGLPAKKPIADVRKVIAVSSAKGGVGKSTIAANLALALARHGHRTGILDVDLFGPSIPTLFNLLDAPPPALTPTTNRLLPHTNYGVKTMSLGYLVPAGAALAWRGLLVAKALQQLLHEVEWGGLDALVLDLPPGTGDVPLTVGQSVVLHGAVVVSTPQDLALADAERGVKMFDTMGVRVLGMVQNMSAFVCPHCQGVTPVFGEKEGVKRACEERGLLLLGDVPLHASICGDADAGVPTVVREPESERGKAFMEIARRVAEEVGL